MVYDNNPLAGGQPSRTHAQKKPIWAVVLIAVVLVGLTVAVGIYKANQNTPTPAPPAPPATTTSPSPTTAPSTATPPTASASASSDTEDSPPNPLYDVLTFLNWPVTSSDPDTRQYESNAQSAFRSYATSLMLYLATQDVDFTSLTDPMYGEWTTDTSGYFTFSGQGFYWYENESVQDDNYYHGAYLSYPGCQLNSGFSLDQAGAPCYSIFLRYTETKTDGDLNDDTYYGMFMVTQADPDSLYLNNQRTAESTMLYRA